MSKDVIVDGTVSVLVAGVSHGVPVFVVSATTKRWLSEEEVERIISILSVSFIRNFAFYSSL